MNGPLGKGRVSGILNAERAESEAWFWGYLFQGAVILGVAPMLIPLIVAQTEGAAAVGIVVAMMFLGQVFSPLIGGVADRTGCYRLFFLGGFCLIGIGSVGFALLDGTLWWGVCALLIGAGAGTSNTTAFSYIVEFRPQKEWDARLGWLQTFYGTGQSIGLALAAILASLPTVGMLVCGLLMVPGFLFGQRRLPRSDTANSTGRHEPVAHQIPAVSHARSPAALVRHYEHLGLTNLRTAFSALFSAFFLWILSWFCIMTGAWLVFNFIPLLMHQSYGVPAWLASLYYAIGATVGIVFYALSGHWAERIGSARVVGIGAFASVLSLSGMLVMTVADGWLQMVGAPLFFLILPVAWSPLIVGGSALSGELAHFSQGTAMGLFNATMAFAAVSAAVVGGWIADVWSYTAVTGAACGFALTGLLLLLPFLVKNRAAPIL